MKALEVQTPYSSFLERLGAAPQRILLLDYDGTLAPFSSDRNTAIPYPEVSPLVGRIVASGTRVALVTGRSAADLARLSSIRPQPEIWGSHGAERLAADGSYHLAPGLAGYKSALETAVDCLRGKGLEERLEIKPASVALHWRGLSRAAIVNLKEQVLQQWMPLLLQHRLRLLDFDGGVELCAPGFNKGDAVRTILAEAAPDAAIAYLGDDLTDEDAFEALRGKGLTVLVRPKSRPTAADIWLQPPKELVQFLQDWLRTCGGEA